MPGVTTFTIFELLKETHLGEGLKLPPSPPPTQIRVKKDIMKNFAEFERKHLNRNPFLVFSCEFFEICYNTFFVEQHRTTTSDYSSINRTERSTGKRNREL